jgi:hypothetical protein
MSEKFESIGRLVCGLVDYSDNESSANYLLSVIEVRQTVVFSEWLASLRDAKAVARIDVRIRRLSLGNYGDAKSVGGGVRELRIDYGPGSVSTSSRGGMS